MSSPFDESFEQLSKGFSQLCDALVATFTPVIEQLAASAKVLIDFTTEHMPELADKLHEDAGRPYGEGSEASLRWLHDKIQEWSKAP